MIYGSVCSGIEAATQAWHPLGWEPAFFSEIEAFPCSVLQHHYPQVPNLGDMTKFEEWPEHAIDLLVGGTPCQSFSVAGLRQGLADPRGNLMLTYLAIARRYQPRWLVWENVPGVLSSNGGRDFGTFIRGLEECGYHAAWRVLDAQYVRVDGFERAVPQRRRRVFVVGYLGDWRRAAAVLLEREGMRWDSAPSRQAGERPSTTISARPTGGGGLGTDFDLDGGLIPFGGNNCSGHINGATAVNAHGGPAGRLDFESETFVAHPMTLAIRGRDGEPDLEWRQDGTANAILTPNGGRAGMGVGAIAFDTTQITSKANVSNPKPGDPCHPSAAGAHAPAIAFDWYASQSQSLPIDEGLCPPLKTTMQPAVAFTCSDQANSFAWERDVYPTLSAQIPNDTSNIQIGIRQGWAVRRLTPTECERLQGFPDNFTAIPHRGKPAADGPRYKALGNSMACNVMRWIGRRIEMVEELTKEIVA
jgi:DNA (cytosine-5)-methyltransferase 1